MLSPDYVSMKETKKIRFICCCFYYSLRYIRSERSIILLNFCLSIVCSNILILVGQTQTHNVVSVLLVVFLFYRCSAYFLKNVEVVCFFFVLKTLVQWKIQAPLDCCLIEYITVLFIFCVGHCERFMNI